LSAENLLQPETPLARCQANPLTSVFIDEQVAIYGMLFRQVVLCTPSITYIIAVL